MQVWLSSAPEYNMQFCTNHKVMNAFISWIEQPKFDSSFARKWGQLYRDDAEAAMCEASFWAILSDCGVNVTPNGDLTGKKQCPDFHCQKDGYRFYVEVTCIKIETATRQTKLTHHPREQKGACTYEVLNETIFGEARQKTSQCADLNVPCLVAVGTFHQQASTLCVNRTHIGWLLTGVPKIAYDYDVAAGACVGEGYQETHFYSSPFTGKPKGGNIRHLRRSISGLLIAGLGCEPPNILGVLHPDSVRPFDPEILLRIPFGRQRIDMSANNVSVEWTQLASDET